LNDFQPDYHNIETVARNEKSPRLSIYEHLINPESMEIILDEPFAELADGDDADVEEFFRHYCGFYRRMTYDTVSFEVCVVDALPGGGALLGERDGPIQNRADFQSYPWDDLPRIFWELAEPKFAALSRNMPAGMKGVGGIGNGPFEISEDLVGFSSLCYMQADDPELLGELYRRIGDLLVDLWTTFMQRWSDNFALCRIGDDMGFKTSTLVAPTLILRHIVPQYRRVIDLVHRGGKKLLWHSCGNIFSIMDAMIEAGIDAKHSNEDAIAPFDQWIDRYGRSIALFGGIDTDRLCRMAPDDVYRFVLEEAARFRSAAKGFALGSGNSIPPYVPRDGYLAMIDAAREIRRREGVSPTRDD